MHRTFQRIGLIAVVGALSAAMPARSLADDAAEARHHDALARSYFEARDFARAIEEFLWAHRIAPNPRLLYNVALCFQQLGDAENAYAYYAEYLAEEETMPGSEQRRALATEALRGLSAEVARVHVATRPEGAVIYVDTEEHGAYGQAPRTLALPEGQHRLVVRREGYEDASVDVVLVRGDEARVELELPRVEGIVELDVAESTPIAIRSSSGETVVEARAPGTFRLPPGVYTVEGRDATHRIVERVVHVRAEESSRLRLVRVPLPTPTSEVTVTANIPEALVSVDGVEVGFTPLLIPEIPVGEHRLRVEALGREAWEGALVVTEEEHPWVTTTLREEGPPPRPASSFVVGGFGVGALAALCVTAPMAARAHDDYRRLRTIDPTRAAEAAARGRFLNRTSDTLLALGLVTLGVGLTLFFVLDAPADQPSSVHVSVTPR